MKKRTHAGLDTAGVQVVGGKDKGQNRAFNRCPTQYWLNAPEQFVRLMILCLGLLIFSLSGCSSHPVEETVTMDASRLSAIPAEAQPVAVKPQLPARDADIEIAGDRIAEAITHLHKRRSGVASRTTPSLRALDQAEAALGRALHAKTYTDSIRDQLREAIKDLNGTESAIKRGAFADAIRDLNGINKRLDALPINSESQNEAQSMPSDH